MKVVSSEFICSEVDLRKFPVDDRFEIVLVGKSNVGKSSFINSFSSRKNLARISSDPGKTRTVNFYLINDGFYFVDMPGYGYAKTGKAQRADFARMIQTYLTGRDKDFAVYFLLDGRHEPSDLDKQVFSWIGQLGINPVVILTKIDKLKRSEQEKLRKIVCQAIGRDEDDGVFSYSTERPELIDAVRSFTAELIRQ